MTTKTMVIWAWASRHLSKSAALYLGGATLIITIAAYLRDFIVPDRRTQAEGGYNRSVPVDSRQAVLVHL